MVILRYFDTIQNSTRNIILFLICESIQKLIIFTNMFKQIKIWLPMAVLALVLPTLVRAKAPPPKTTNTINEYYNLNISGQVLCQQITIMDISPLALGQPYVITDNDTKITKTCNIINLLKADRPAKSLYLNLILSGKDRVGWQSDSRDNLKSKGTNRLTFLSKNVSI